MPPRQHRHVGVYGVCLVEGCVLLIRKARGPYTGLLDLPGGGIGFGEEPDATLRREFVEEAGLIIASAVLQQAASKVVRYRTAEGMEEELHHLGLLYRVSLDSADPLPAPKSVADGEDSNGAAWVRLTELQEDMLTPFARLALF